MSRKKELLDFYANYYYRNIKYFFPMLIDEIDIKEVKNNIDESNNITKEKKKIDDVFKTKLSEYLQTKFNIMRYNSNFVFNEHDKFQFDYELADKILWLNNYKTYKFEIEFPELRDDISIKDCKNIIRDFYTDLLNDNPNDIVIINDLLDNKLNIKFEDCRGTTNSESKEMNVSYSDDLYFLIILVHEVSHAFASSKTTIPIEFQDIRNVEVESLFIEKLFMKYLMDKELPIIKDKDGIRAVNESDFKKYFIYSYSSLLSYSFRIMDELDFVNTVDDDNIIDKEFIDDYLYNSPYEHNFIIQCKFVDEIMDNYLEDEDKNVSYFELKDRAAKEEVYRVSELKSFEANIRYLVSGVLAWYFEDICSDKKQVDKFKDYLRQSRDYSSEEFAYLFDLEIDDTLAIASKIVERFKEYVKDDDIKVNHNPIVSDDYIKAELAYYERLKDNTINGDDRKQQQLIIIKKMFELFDTDEVSLDMNPFEIQYQLDDSDVDKYEEYKKKILELKKSD